MFFVCLCVRACVTFFDSTAVDLQENDPVFDAVRQITPAARRIKHKRKKLATKLVFLHFMLYSTSDIIGWLGSRVVSVLDSGAEVPGFKSQSRRYRVTVLGKLFTSIVPLFIKQRN